MQLALFGCFRRHIETVLCVTHGTAWGKNPTCCMYQKRFIENMGISHSVLWACDHHWLHYDIRFLGGTYARSMRLATVVSFTTYAVSLTGLSHYSPGILAFMRIPVSSSHVGVPVGTVAASWALFLSTMSMSSFVTAQERQPCLSRV